MAVDLDFSKPAGEINEDKPVSQVPVNLSFAPSQTVSKPVQPVVAPAPQEAAKPKSWQENKKLAVAIGVIGFIIIVAVFYYLFSSAGII